MIMRKVLISLLQDCYVSYTMFDNVQQAIMEHRIPLEHKYDGVGITKLKN